jgi:hypothetical protein
MTNWFSQGWRGPTATAQEIQEDRDAAETRELERPYREGKWPIAPYATRAGDVELCPGCGMDVLFDPWPRRIVCIGCGAATCFDCYTNHPHVRREPCDP